MGYTQIITEGTGVTDAAKVAKTEQERQAIYAEAGRLGVPAFMTPTWQKLHAEPQRCARAATFRAAKRRKLADGLLWALAAFVAVCWLVSMAAPVR